MPQYSVINPTRLVNGQTEDVSDVLSNFQQIATIINALKDDNIDPAAALAISKLAGYPANARQTPWGDGAWRTMPLITASALSGGPPGSPTDGDIWIATGAGSNGEIWEFRYNAGSASSFKWEFLGGAVLMEQDSSHTYNQVNHGAFEDPTASLTSVPAITLSRAGDYQVMVQAEVSTVSADTKRIRVDGSVAGSMDTAVILAANGADIIATTERVTYAAGNTTRIGIRSDNQDSTWSKAIVRVVPVRIA